MQTIAGKTTEEIRKAYFSRKVDKLLDEIQSQGKIEDAELQKLIVVLEEFEAENKSVKSEVRQKAHSGFDDVIPPSVQELMQNETKAKEWEDEMNVKASRMYSIIIAIGNKFGNTNSKPDKQQLMNFAHECTGLMGYLSDYLIYRKQMYYKRLTEMIDDYGISRREAEDRSKITEEYAQWKKLEYLEKQVDLFIMNCKKEYSENYN